MGRRDLVVVWVGVPGWCSGVGRDDVGSVRPVSANVWEGDAGWGMGDGGWGTVQGFTTTLHDIVFVG